MHRPSYESIVDQMASTLAERRRSRIERHTAYVALARAILADNETSCELEDLRQLDSFVTAGSYAA